jgi:hypothetical protein
MEEELSFNNILGEEDIETLFSDPEENVEEKEEIQAKSTEKEEPSKETTKTTEVVEPEDLFEEEEEEEKQPESVGSEKKKEEEKVKEDAVTDEETGTSPNFYSSIANALAVDGIFPNLDEETIKKAEDAESFSELIDAEVNARLDEKQLRVSKALDNGVEPTDIRRYENTLNYINSITDEQITEESEKGEQLRRNLIYQDFLNKGYSPEKAQKFTDRTIDAGTDVEDAKEALQSNKEFFQDSYDALLKEAQDKADEEKAERVKQSEQIRESIMKDKNLFGDIRLDATTRKKVLDNILKPVWKDPETGNYYTALQKYELEHRGEFLKYAGLIYTITDGFKDFESFTKEKVKKEVKKGLRELEQTLSNTRRNTQGELKMVTGVKEDPESYISKGFTLDL